MRLKYTILDLPEGMTELHCDKCGRRGRYRRETLLERFGPEIALPDLRHKIAKCPRKNSKSDPCYVTYTHPLETMADEDDFM